MVASSTSKDMILVRCYWQCDRAPSCVLTIHPHKIKRDPHCCRSAVWWVSLWRRRPASVTSVIPGHWTILILKSTLHTIICNGFQSALPNLVSLHEATLDIYFSSWHVRPLIVLRIRIFPSGAYHANSQMLVFQLINTNFASFKSPFTVSLSLDLSFSLSFIISKFQKPVYKIIRIK